MTDNQHGEDRSLEEDQLLQAGKLVLASCAMLYKALSANPAELKLQSVEPCAWPIQVWACLNLEPYMPLWLRKAIGCAYSGGPTPSPFILRCKAPQFVQTCFRQRRSMQIILSSPMPCWTLRSSCKWVSPTSHWNTQRFKSLLIPGRACQRQIRTLPDIGNACMWSCSAAPRHTPIRDRSIRR